MHSELDMAQGFITLAREAYDAGDREAAQANIGEAEAALDRARQEIDAQEA
jgi:hypothetical protein